MLVMVLPVISRATSAHVELSGCHRSLWAGLVAEVKPEAQARLMPSIEAVDVDDDVLWLIARVPV